MNSTNKKHYAIPKGYDKLQCDFDDSYENEYYVTYIGRIMCLGKH